MFSQPARPVSALSAAEVPALWTLDGVPVASARRLECWLDALATIPMTEWIRVGERCIHSRDALLTTTVACSHIERVVDAQGLHVTAWLVRDMVETTVFDIRQQAAHAPRRVRAHIAIARMAAEWAALAIATEAWIPRADLETMCAMFESIVSAPVDSTAS